MESKWPVIWLYNQGRMKRLAQQSQYAFSNYLQALYQGSVRAQTPYFTVNSDRISIIEDPLDFYLMLKNGISQASHRIGLSSLYFGTGTLERHLLATMAARHRRIPKLRTAIVFDHHRSHREDKGESPYELLTQFAENVGDQVELGFVKVGGGKGVLGEVLGVHHQKIYLFDDKVIMGGANLSHNYFLNRRDRYLCINCPQLSGYLFEYIRILAGSSSPEQLKTHYKLWKFAHMPTKYEATFQEQEKVIKETGKGVAAEQERSFTWQRKQQKQLVLNRNQQIAEQIGGSITEYQEIKAEEYREKRQTVRDRLFNVASEDYVSNELQILGDPFEQPLTTTGEQVHIFPFIQWPLLNQSQQIKIFEEVLELAAKQSNLIKLSSGYLNLDLNMFDRLSQKSELTPTMQLLCSAPQANSFFKGGGVKNMIPVMYRCFEENLLQKMGDKCLIKQFSNGRWSFHAKGLWIKEAQNSCLTVVGSSNFNARAKDRDSELQLYIYSSCKAFNARLDKQWEHIQSDCKPVSLQQIKEDDQVGTGWLGRNMAWLASRWL